ncbi:hypothetical protein N665_0150s0001 [Sinapis alba]|nr:hypothetical protein N665_0150s0001 [Sinapis alba]
MPSPKATTSLCVCWWNQELISISGTTVNRILISEYIPNVPNFWSLLKSNKFSVSGFDQRFNSVLKELELMASVDMIS